MRQSLTRGLIITLLLTLPLFTRGQRPAPPAFIHTSEDWTTPSLKTSHLTPQPPFVAETDRRPRFTRELVQVQWREGDAINLFVIRPVGVTRPPVVLYLYGYPADTSRFLKDDYDERLTRGGCAAVGFESALTGGRYRMRPLREWFVSQLPEALATTAHDVPMILDYLTTRGDLDMTRVGMFGEGSGGAIVVLAAAVDPRIRAVDLLNPWGDWPEWLKGSDVVPDNERPRYLTPEFRRSVSSLEPVVWMTRLRGRHVRLIQSADDSETPPAARAALARAIPLGGQFQQYDSNMAMFNALGGGRLFSWIGQQLGATAPKPAVSQNSDTN